MTDRDKIITMTNTPFLKSGISPVKTVLATVEKELIILKRYLPNLLGTFLQIGLRIGFFLFLSSIISFSGTYSLAGKDLFIFIACSFLLFVFFSTALWTPLNTVTTDLYNGTLEYLYTLPSSQYAYFVGTVLASSLVNMVFFIPLFVFLSFYSGAELLYLIMVLLVCMVGILTTIALGILISLLGLLWKQIHSFIGFLAMVFEFLAGAYAPISEYPLAVKYLAYLLPFTWGYDLVRYYMFQGRWKTICPIGIEWIIFIAIAVFYLFVSRLLLKTISSRIKRNGLHLL